jgi:hypothetical protein
MVGSTPTRFRHIYLAAFIFEIAKARAMVVRPGMEDFVPILSAPEQRNELPPDLQASQQGPIWCRSASELEVLLSDGYAAWQKYLDQVLNSPPQELKLLISRPDGVDPGRFHLIA